MSSKQEYWLSGPIPDVPALLQPAAHALLQSVREVKSMRWIFPRINFGKNHMTGLRLGST